MRTQPSRPPLTPSSIAENEPAPHELVRERRNEKVVE